MVSAKSRSIKAGTFWSEVAVKLDLPGGGRTSGHDLRDKATMRHRNKNGGGDARLALTVVRYGAG